MEPRSAGASLGPVCYGRGGGEPTLTDANVVLGYVRTGELAGGEVTIDPEAARIVIHERIAQPLGLTLLQAAEGIHRIANARTMRALRQVSTERGRDSRDFVLIAFGGSGPVHGAGLAAELGIGRVLVPPLPGLFSDIGLLLSGVEHHDVRSVLVSNEELPMLEPVRTVSARPKRPSMKPSVLAPLRACACRSHTCPSLLGWCRTGVGRSHRPSNRWT